jgi:hypothetical protein
MKVAHGGADMTVTKQALQRGQIDPGLQQVGGKGVTLMPIAELAS